MSGDDDNDIFIVIGEASLQLISVFTLTYLQHEITEISKICEKIPSKLLSITAMWFAYCLIFLSTLLVDHWIRTIISILLIIVLSIGINYTYKDYTIDEGFYISIPYFIIYSYLVFVFGIIEYPFYTFNSSIILLSSLTCYILFAMNILFGIELYRSYLNYIAFLGLIVSTINVRLIIAREEHQQIKSIIDLLMFQFVHIYQYLTHLLSVKFELEQNY